MSSNSFAEFSVLINRLQGARLAAVFLRLLLLVVACGLLIPAPAEATAVVGATATVVRRVEATLQATIRTLVIKDEVHETEKIKTAELSATRLLFSDETNFMIGPRSEITIDKFLYDPTPGKGKLFLSMSRGLMKFRSGVMESSAYKVKTRVATMGIRGTEFAVQVRADGTTHLYVLSGIVTITDNQGRSLDVRKGESAVVYPEGSDGARNGPILFEGIDPEFQEDIRELVSMIVFHEDTQLEQTDAAFNFGGPMRLGIFTQGNLPLFSFSRFPNQQNRNFRQVAPGQTLGPGLSTRPLNGFGTDSNYYERGLDGGTQDSRTASSTGAQDPAPPTPPTPSNDGFLVNGDFEAGKVNWTTIGPGTFDIVFDDPTDPDSNRQALLTSGSPVTIIAELISTPATVFTIQFEAEFLDGAGVLDVLLDNQLLASFFPGDAATQTLLQITVNDSRFGNLKFTGLAFIFDAPHANARLKLDNVLILATGEQFSTSVPTSGAWTPVSAPPAGVLMLSALLIAVSAGRFRRKKRPPVA